MRHLMMLFALFVLGRAAPAAACSCVPPPPPLEALDGADAVFAGEVLRVQRVQDASGYAGYHVTLRVERRWKGAAGDERVVRTAFSSAACGYAFERGESYLVYAYEHEGQLHTNICTRTALLEAADEDLEVLGGGEDGGASPRCGGLTNLAAVQALLLVILGLALTRRRR